MNEAAARILGQQSRLAITIEPQLSTRIAPKIVPFSGGLASLPSTLR
jgi:hypothetical protein